MRAGPAPLTLVAFGGSTFAPSGMLKTIRARWQLGYLYPEQVPDLAAGLLNQGVDSPALRQLAGLVRPSREDIDPLMRRLSAELRLEPIPRAEALRLIIEHVAEGVATGTIEPYAGAAELHGLWSDAGGSEYQGVFAVALDDYDQVPEARAEIAEDIRGAAHQLLQQLRNPQPNPALQVTCGRALFLSRLQPGRSRLS